MTGPANQFHQTPSHLLSPPLSETEEKQANTGFIYFLARKRQGGEREGREREREGGRERGKEEEREREGGRERGRKREREEV